MKTTKKAIETAVRANDITALFKMFGGNRAKLHSAINMLPVKKLSNMAYVIAYGSENRYRHDYRRISVESRIVSPQVQAILRAKKQVSEGTTSTNYVKVLIEGEKHIYWAHPAYGHDDYNKSRALDNTEANRELMRKINSYLMRHIG